ncbi:6076_t:CDS:2, partial [Funneliformis geosporum]
MDVLNKKKGGGRPLNEIWKHFERFPIETPGKFQACCNFCPLELKRAEIVALEEHLANHCSNASGLILREYMQKVLARNNSKKRKLDNSQTIITSFHDYSDLPKARITRSNHDINFDVESIPDSNKEKENNILDYNIDNLVNQYVT